MFIHEFSVLWIQNSHKKNLKPTLCVYPHFVNNPQIKTVFKGSTTGKLICENIMKWN